MLERLIRVLKTLEPREITAGEAMANFSHDKNCSAFGKGMLEQADFLQIGQEERFGITPGNPWDGIGGLFSRTYVVTYIQCSSCGATKVFQERN